MTFPEAVPPATPITNGDLLVKTPVALAGGVYACLVVWLIFSPEMTIEGSATTGESVWVYVVLWGWIKGFPPC